MRRGESATRAWGRSPCPGCMKSPVKRLGAAAAGVGLVLALGACSGSGGITLPTNLPDDDLRRRSRCRPCRRRPRPRRQTQTQTQTETRTETRTETQTQTVTATSTPTTVTVTSTATATAAPQPEPTSSGLPALGLGGPRHPAARPHRPHRLADPADPGPRRVGRAARRHPSDRRVGRGLAGPPDHVEGDCRGGRGDLAQRWTASPGRRPGASHTSPRTPRTSSVATRRNSCAAAWCRR